MPAVSEVALPPVAAVATARTLLTAGRAFSAHEVFEARWKAGPADERELWQGLAQVCVGLTHLQRGNPVGAATLLRRGGGHLADRAPAYGLTPERIAAQARDLADQVVAGAGTGWLQL